MSVSSKRRVFGGQVVGPAGWAADGIGVGSAADELLELRPAIVALVFEDRHVFILRQAGGPGLERPAVQQCQASFQDSRHHSDCCIRDEA